MADNNLADITTGQPVNEGIDQSIELENQINSVESVQLKTRLGFIQHIFVTPKNAELIEILGNMRGENELVQPIKKMPVAANDDQLKRAA